MTGNTPIYLDLTQWPRRDAFAHFRNFDAPCFNICARLDVTQLKRCVHAAGFGSLSLAYHYLAIRIANAVTPFRYRLEGDRVRVHGAVHGSTTVLRDDETFGFATLEHADDFATFADRGALAIRAARSVHARFEPTKDDEGVIHMTTLPWLHFTSYSNARQWGNGDSIPKIAFGRIDAEGDRLWMPISVEVHHALVDGLHVGQFMERLEAALRDPGPWLAPNLLAPASE